MHFFVKLTFFIMNTPRVIKMLIGLISKIIQSFRREIVFHFSFLWADEARSLNLPVSEFLLRFSTHIYLPKYDTLLLPFVQSFCRRPCQGRRWLVLRITACLIESAQIFGSSISCLALGCRVLGLLASNLHAATFLPGVHTYHITILGRQSIASVHLVGKVCKFGEVRWLQTWNWLVESLHRLRGHRYRVAPSRFKSSPWYCL